MFSFKKKKNFKEQRDRFLAYAFASADLFIEVDTKDTIVYATGAIKALTGIDHVELPGKKWLTIFESKHHEFLQNIRKQAMPGIRQGPFLIDLNHNLGGKQAILTSIKLPNSKHFFITLGLSNALLSKLSKLMEEHEDGPMLTGFVAEDLKEHEPLTTDHSPDSDPDTVLETDFEPEDLQPDPVLTTDFEAEEQSDEALTTGYIADDIDHTALTTGFEAEDLSGKLATGFITDEAGNIIDERSELHNEAKRVFKYAKRNNLSASVTIFEFSFDESADDETKSEIIARISALMRNEALADCPPIHIKEQLYGLLHDSDKKIDKFIKHIEKISKEFDPVGHGVTVKSKTIDACLNAISSDEATRALLHTINAIRENKDDAIELSLAKNMQKLVTSNRDKYAEFKGIIDRVDFSIGFQPVMETKTRETEFYEVLSRVNRGDIGDWVLFGEDNGLAPKFDLAVLERAMNYIHFKAGTTRTRYAVNISSKSIENKKFYEQFHEKLMKRDLSTRLLIEINNPWTIENLPTLESFVSALTELNYKIVLDKVLIDRELPDLLKKIDASYLKISYKAIKRMCEEQEGKELIDEIIAICKEQNIRIVGQFVEEQEQLDFLEELGIPCAQGYFFGKAEPAPKFIPPTK